MWLFCRRVYLHWNSRLRNERQGQSTPQRLVEGRWQVCEMATGLRSLFTVVWLRDQLACLSPLTGSTVRKVSCPVCLQEVSRISTKPGMPWERRVIFRIACDWFVTHATFTTKVGVSFVYHMNDDAPEVNGLTPPMLPDSLLPFENKSLGTRLVKLAVSYWWAVDQS